MTTKTRAFLAGAIALAASFFGAPTALAGSPCQYIVTGAVLTAAQWNSCFAQHQDNLGYTPVNKAGDGMQGLLTTIAPTVSTAGFRLYPGVAPTAPTNGDLWMTSTGLYGRVSGATVGPFAASFGITSLTGDVTGTGPGATATTLATVNSNVGSFGSSTQVGTFTVNGKGLITAAANVTVTPAVGSITGLGTGVGTALGVNVGSAGAFVTFNGALGTPSSGVVTNLTGTASININGTVGATSPTTGAFTTGVFSSTLTLSTNNNAIIGRSTGAVATNLLKIDNSDQLVVGGASNANIVFTIAGATPWSINGSSNFTPLTDNAFDIGIAATNRIRSLYVGTSITIGAGSAITSSGAGGALGSNAFTSTAYLPLAGGTVTGPLIVSGTNFGLSGNFNAALGTAGLRYKNVAATITDTTTGASTIAAAYTDVFGGNTIASTNAITVTKYYTAYFTAPTAAANVTMTNKSAIGADSISIGGAAQGTTALAVTGDAAISGNLVSPNWSGQMTGATSAYIVTSGSFGYIASNAAGTAVQRMYGTGIYNSANSFVGWTSSTDATTTNLDLQLTRSGVASLQQGAADAAVAVAQTTRVQSVVAGTAAANGANWTLIGSLPTGTGTSGDIIFQTGVKTGSGTTQGTATTALTIKGETQVLNAATGIAIAGATIGSNALAVTGTSTFSGNATFSAPVTAASIATTAAHTSYSGTAIPAGGTAGAGYLFSSTANFGTFFGSGVPTLSAAQGSVYLRSDGTPYYNSSSGSGTTWTSLASGSGTVTSVVASTGLTGGTITTTGTIAVDVATTANIWAGTANKVLDAANVFNGAGALVSCTGTSTAACDFGAGFNFTFTGTTATNYTLGNPSNSTKIGQTGCIYLIQPASGTVDTIAFGSNWKSAGGSSTYTLTATLGAVDRVCYIVRTSTFIDFSFAKNIN